jgi:hypothetical protein
VLLTGVTDFQKLIEDLVDHLPAGLFSGLEELRKKLEDTIDFPVH